MKLCVNSSLLFLILLFPFCGALGAAPATVFLPADAAPEEKKAAEELAYYWEKMTGDPAAIEPEKNAAPPLLRYHRFGAWRPLPIGEAPGTSFYVGDTRAARLEGPLPEDLDEDGFVLRGSGDRLVLRGASPTGTRFAVSRFLHRYGGVRWYLPTELGEHVPEWEYDGLPEIDLVEEPAFRSRYLGSATRFTESEWEKRNLLKSRYRYNHNVHRIFTEEVYDLRPDFFIMLGGERIRPDDSLGGHNYQICFGNPDAAKFAARKAAEFFDENPDEISYSLAMTDTDAICQCSYCQALIDPDKTFRDRPDYSDLIFTFMNRAAKELEKTHPDKYLGTLAYHWAENVPSFPVHPKVLPYLTADRPQWQNEAFREEDRDLMARWGEAGPERLGLWDYYFGSSYAIPRVFTGITAESLRHARAAGIDGFYAQLYSNWSLDGPKGWLTSQLLWDPEQDHEELLDEYYSDFFQEASAPMRAFYERAEEIWMEQGEPVYWLKFYFDFSQLELFPPAVNAELRELLSEAEELAESDLVRERVELVSEGFRQTELYSELYHGVKEKGRRLKAEGRRETAEARNQEPGTRNQEHAYGSEKTSNAQRSTSNVQRESNQEPRTNNQEPAPGSERQGVNNLLEELVEKKEELETYYEEVIHPNGLHRPTERFEARARYLPGMKLDGVMARVVRASSVQESESDETELLNDQGEEDAGSESYATAVDGRIFGLIGEVARAFPESRPGLAMEIARAVAREETKNLLANGDFRLDQMLAGPEEDLFSSDYTPFSWNRWGGEIGENVMKLSDEAAAKGSLSLVARGAVKEAMYQRFDIEPGEKVLLRADARGRVSPGSRVEIELRWVTEAGETIDLEFLDIDPLLPGTYDDWTPLEIYAEAPPEARGAFASLTVHHQASEDEVFFDNVKLLRVETLP